MQYGMTNFVTSSAVILNCIVRVMAVTVNIMNGILRIQAQLVYLLLRTGNTPTKFIIILITAGTAENAYLLAGGRSISIPGTQP